MKKTNHAAAYLAAALLWMGVLYILSSIPGLSEQSSIWGLDKVEHFIAYGVLGFLLTRSLLPWERRLGAFVIVIATLIVAIYGGLDEFHQMFVPGRTASVMDLLADVIGGFCASFLVYVLHSYRGRRVFG